MYIIIVWRLSLTFYIVKKRTTRHFSCIYTIYMYMNVLNRADSCSFIREYYNDQTVVLTINFRIPAILLLYHDVSSLSCCFPRYCLILKLIKWNLFPDNSKICLNIPPPPLDREHFKEEQSILFVHLKLFAMKFFIPEIFG